MRLLLLPAALLALAGCEAEPAAAGSDVGVAEPPADAGAPGADLPLVEVASAEALVDDLDGLDAETVVLNFWATWCAPCRAEFPEFIAYDAEQDGAGVEVRFVSLDQPRDLSLVRAFLAEHEVSEPSYLYTGQGNLTAQLNPFAGSGAIPITMVLDADRIVQHTHVGIMSRTELAEAVSAVRAGRDPAASSSPDRS